MMGRDTGHPQTRGPGQILPSQFSEGTNPMDTLVSDLESSGP